MSRRDNGLIQHSEKLCIDVDDVDPEVLKDKLKIDNYIYSMFTSISGHGIKLLFNINSKKHKESYYGIAAYLLSVHGIIVDPQSMVLSRSQIISYDPFIYINKKAILFDNIDRYKERDIPQKELAEFIYEEDDFKRIIESIDNKNVNLCESYNDWIRVGFSIVHEFGLSGEHYFHIISKQSRKYDHQICKKQYKYLVTHRSESKVTISTFYWYCKQAGLETVSEKTKRIKSAIESGKQIGLTKQQVEARLGVDVSKFWDNINISVFGDNTIKIIEDYLNFNHKLIRNAITLKIEDNGKILEEHNMNTVFLSSKKINSKISKDLFFLTINSDFIPSYNPLHDYFKIIAPAARDFEVQNNHEFNTAILDSLCKTIINDDPEYTSYFVKKWLVSVMSSIYGTPSPLVLVFVGPQNTGKTEWFRRLLPEQLKYYMAQSKLDRDKDDEVLMSQKIIILDDEYAGKSKRESSKIKEWTSKDVITLRRPYGRDNVDLKRLAVLCGTTNEEGILTDYTGNRRIIPIFVKDVDRSMYNRVDKTALWKEIAMVYSQGFDWRLSREDIIYVNKDKHIYEMIRVEEELVSMYYSPSSDHEWLMTSEIKVEIEKSTNQRLDARYIEASLKKFGFLKKSVRRGKDNTSKRWGIKRNDMSNNYNTMRPDKDSVSWD